METIEDSTENDSKRDLSKVTDAFSVYDKKYMQIMYKLVSYLDKEKQEMFKNEGKRNELINEILSNVFDQMLRLSGEDKTYFIDEL